MAFDQKVKFERVINNAVGPKDDYWTARIPTSAMPAGIDPTSLHAKSFLAVEGRPPLWEEEEHTVQTPRVDQQMPLKGNQPPYRRMVNGEIAQGKVTLQLDQRSDINGYPDMGGSYVGLSGLRLEPKAGQFKGAEELLAMVVPHTRFLDRALASGPNYQFDIKSERNLRDVDGRNLVTLRRQPDGSFAAKAAPGQVYTSHYDYRPYGNSGDDTESLGYDLVIVDPSKGQSVPPPSQEGEFVSIVSTR